MKTNNEPVKLKVYQMTLDEKQAGAVGFAIKQALRNLNREGLDKISADLRDRLEAAYANLDTCPEAE